jgi:phospholipid-binding lipoprotein MlaA
MLMGCASVSHEHAASVGDGNVVGAAVSKAIPPDSERIPDSEAVPQEIVEAFPEGAEPTPSEILSEQDGSALVATTPPGPPDSETSVDLTAQSSESSSAYDPWEPFNRKVHRFNAVVDKAVARPVAEAYVAVMPTSVRTGVNNFFDNLGQPVTALNALLQGRVRHSAEALGRFLLNSTVGIAGLFDPAARLKMAERDEDFGQTLANWGWTRSRYIELPFFGPSTVRDVIGLVGDSHLQPLAHVESDKIRVGLHALGLVDGRARLLNLDALRDEAQDDYLLVRDSWTQRRDFQIQNDADQGAALPDYLKE